MNMRHDDETRNLLRRWRRNERISHVVFIFMCIAFISAIAVLALR